MRIRTIKPEFYRSETLAGVSREFRDLAKALISCADDEGYFASHPRLIAADCYPFDLDGPEFVTRGLSVLSAIGFCELYDGNVGFLPTFKENQRISHPAASKLKTKKGEKVSAVPVVAEPVPQSLRSDSAVVPQVLRTSSAVAPEDVYREQGTGNREGNRDLAGKKPAKTKPEKPPPNPRHTPLVQALTEVYEFVTGASYGFQDRDPKEVQRLLAMCPDNDGIVFRWRWALEKSRDKFHTPKVHRLADLVEHWNAYPAVKPEAQHEFEPIEGGLI